MIDYFANKTFIINIWLEFFVSIKIAPISLSLAIIRKFDLIGLPYRIK